MEKINRKLLTKRFLKILVMSMAIFAFVIFMKHPQHKLHDAMKDFEFAKYSGKWYQIARVENKAEKGCVGDVVEYAIRQDGKISFEHSCYIGEKLIKKSGQGKFLKTPDVAILEFKNSGFFSFWSYRYNVVDVGPDYSFAIVAGRYSNGEEFVWLLSRDDRMDYKLFLEAVDSMKTHGLDIDRLIYVKHKT